MKKISILILSILLSISAFAQTYSVLPIYQELQYYIQNLETEYKSQIIRLEVDITTGVSSSYRYLSADQTYTIVVLADREKIADIDLTIYKNVNNRWIKVAEDTETEKMAVLNFSPEKSDIYKFEITVQFLDNQQFGFYSLIIMR